MTGVFSRRAVVAGVLCAGSAIVLGRSGAWGAQPDAAMPRAANTVNEKDPMAVALGYVSDAARVDPKTSPAYQAGALCSGCSWYQGKAGDGAGPCSFFPGKMVDASGWCRMWNKKR